MPKSGEVDENVAPIAAVASMAMTVSGMLGSQAATRSPGPTPVSANAVASAATCARSSSQVRVRRRPSSPASIRAAPAPLVARKVSTTLSRASGKNRASGREALGTKVIAPCSPTIPQASQAAAQNAPGSATDQRVQPLVARVALGSGEGGQLCARGPFTRRRPDRRHTAFLASRPVGAGGRPPDG